MHNMDAGLDKIKFRAATRKKSLQRKHKPYLWEPVLRKGAGCCCPGNGFLNELHAHYGEIKRHSAETDRYH